MAFEIFTIANYGDKESPFAYPVTDEQGQLVEEKWDNGLGSVLTSTSFTMLAKTRHQSQFQLKTAPNCALKFALTVTDSRVACLCDDYDFGDVRYSGLSTNADVLNLFQRRRAKKRSAGKVYLGHLRYEWLESVGYKRKVSMNTKDELRLLYRDDEGTDYVLDFAFPKGTDTEFLANDILRRCCLYRLSMTDTENENRQKGTAFLEKYSTGGRIEPDENPKEYHSTITLPYWYRAPGGEKFRPEVQ
jgi:hypothetical protein